MNDRVALRPAGESDVELILRLTNDPAAAGEFEWYGWRDPGAIRRSWAENCLLGDGLSVLMVVVDEQVVGFVSWHKRQTARTSYCWNLGVSLAPEARGRGYGSEAQRQLVRYLFSHTQVNRVEAATDVANLAEQRALEKAGFTREGVERGVEFRNGGWHDRVMYSVLRDEVPA